jgi:hypothetical protein
MSKLFISHATSDRMFVDAELTDLLKALGFDVWFAEEAIHAADYWEREIRTGLESSDWIVLVMSPTSAKSEWVKNEINWAIENRQGRLIPILIADCKPSDFHMSLPRIQYFDFRNPTQDARKRFIKLLVDAEYMPHPQTHYTRDYVESLIVEITDTDRFFKSGDCAIVHAPNGCERILNWLPNRFTWTKLRARAEEDRGKGTFWITEMQDVMKDIADGVVPRVMTSTFRGRGHQVKGQIFHPQLHHSHSNNYCLYYHFDFYEVLVPELVRGPDLIGEVFFLLYIASRVRWEVLNPFFVKPFLRSQPEESPLDENEQYKLINEVSGRLRIIELEIDRHNNENVIKARFKGAERDLLLKMLDERNNIRKRVTCAIECKNYSELMRDLGQGLELNIKATMLLTEQFLELVRSDQKEVESMLTILRNSIEL